MSITLNRFALAHAEKLIERGDVTRDERDDWSEHAPNADAENRYINSEGWSAYSTWHLGIDRQESDETKGRFSFPMGDFRTLHRCALISLESQAAQHGHDEIARAAQRLLDKIGRPADPTAVREQPALTTSTGAIWLIVGGLFAAVSLGVLIPMATLPGGTVAVVAAIVVATLFLGMVIARFAIPPGRRRLGTLAATMLLIAAVALGGVLIVAASAWNAVGSGG